MIDLPGHVADLILRSTIESRTPAFVVVGRDGTVVRRGGSLIPYGLDGLREKAVAVEHATFLCGLLPLREASLFLPGIEVGAGVVADIYMARGEDGDCVLLLDASARNQEYQRLLQKANELNLLRERLGQALAPESARDVTATALWPAFDLKALAERKQLAVVSSTLMGLAALREEGTAIEVIETVESLMRRQRQVVEREAGVLLSDDGETLTAVFGLIPTDRPAAHDALVGAAAMLDAVDGLAAAGTCHSAIGIACGPVIAALRNNIVRATGAAIDTSRELARRGVRTKIITDETTMKECHLPMKCFTLEIAAPGNDPTYEYTKL